MEKPRKVILASVNRQGGWVDWGQSGAMEEAESRRPSEKHEQVVTESLAVKVKQELKVE